MSDADSKLDKQTLITRMNEGLRDFLAFLDQYSAEQLLEPKDAVGWNARDHITHLAVWADGVAALLRHEDRWAAMGISEALGESHDFDAMNAAIVVQHRHLSPQEARRWLVIAHEQLVAAMVPLDDDGLLLSYERFVPPFTGDGGSPIVAFIKADTYEHYEEHAPWIEKLIREG
ncbi:MAG: ClbS/DfsB family four-helix bundle protein [Anaerolineaceae bacterium]|nr:ClbS/DfsB family four-helix bundle protein [Anaerolineaceae bacterium]